MAVVSRLSIDRLRRAATERAAYAGTWLPEPIAGILTEVGGRVFANRVLNPDKLRHVAAALPG